MSVVALRWRSNVETPRREVAEQQSPEKPKNEPNNTAADQRAAERGRVSSGQRTANELSESRFAIHACAELKMLRSQTTLREIATDFIPLRYMNAASLQDGGQIVRVELPRSALANFGLPVNMDRYNEKVKADVIFGVDGLAHAIRFVQ